MLPSVGVVSTSRRRGNSGSLSSYSAPGIGIVRKVGG